MVRVVLSGNLRHLTGGESEFEVEAGNIGQLFRVLARRYPDLEPHLEEGVAVAIDGQIFQEALFEPIPPDAEVHLMPQIAGG
ncbi:MAG: MoaD/ThiS family protein [Kiloniellales bacterium]|jgi:molybdopterin converting factor small subunit